jgi:hypothetical protein
VLSDHPENLPKQASSRRPASLGSPEELAARRLTHHQHGERGEEEEEAATDMWGSTVMDLK